VYGMARCEEGADRAGPEEEELEETSTSFSVASAPKPEEMAAEKVASPAAGRRC
jgi:hypothetical protein